MKTPPSISIEPFGTVDGKTVELYTLTNNKGTQVKLSSYGGTITSWTIPMADGSSSPIILGFDTLEEYLAQPFYLGATIGRYANLINGASFPLDGNTYILSSNHKGHHLHGGTKGFDKQHWNVAINPYGQPGLTLSRTSRDMEEGYPGNLDVSINFQLNDDDELSIGYYCQTDKPTPVNLTNHMYFNLNGNFDRHITDHHLLIDADHITPANVGITTGEVLHVSGTPFDFRTNSPLATGIEAIGGYNHNFLLNKANDWERQPKAILSTAGGDRQLEVYTTEPALQLYTGNSLSGGFRDRSGTEIGSYSGLCLETQQIPNSPNHPHFPSTVLQPGQTYTAVTKYKISCRC